MNSFFVSIFILTAGAAALGFFLAHMANSSRLKQLVKKNEELFAELEKLDKNCLDLKHQAHLLQRSNFSMEGEINSLKLKLKRAELLSAKKQYKTD